MNKLYLLIVMFIACRICHAQNFQNSSVEIWGIVNACEINTAPDNWTDYSNGSGIGMDELNFSICSTTIPPNAANGSVYARAWAGTTTTGEGMYQNLSGIIPGNSYQIYFEYAGSNLFGGTNDIQWHIFIDDIDINQSPVFSSIDTFWTAHSFHFTATDTLHKIGFRAYTAINGSSGSAAIDNFVFTNTTNVGNINTNLELLIFPVPFRNKLNISIKCNELLEITLLDIFSRSIQQVKFTNSISVDTEQLSKGIYLYEVRNKNGVIKKGKLVKD